MNGRETRTGEAPRAPFEQAVALRFRRSGEFVDEQAANVSTGGMFIRTRNPHPVGAVFEFRFHLGDNQPLLAGKAQVAWIRRRSQGADEPSGMGVRFVELADESRRQIAQLVAEHDNEGGRPVEIEPAEPAPAGQPAEPERDVAAIEAPVPAGQRDPAATDSAPAAVPLPAAPATPPEGRAMSARAERRRYLPRILMAAVLLAAITAALWPPAAPAPRATDESAPLVRPLQAPSERITPAADEPAAKPAQLQLVDDWSRAWSEQRVEAYFDAYSPRFTPPQGLDRATWQRQRRARILAPVWIVVDLALIELEEIDAGRSRVRFVQAYESDSYRDVVRKTLDLERHEGAWKILRETVEP